MISSWYALAAGADLAGGVAAGVAGLAWVTAMSSRRLVTAGGRGGQCGGGGGGPTLQALAAGGVRHVAAWGTYRIVLIECMPAAIVGGMLITTGDNYGDDYGGVREQQAASRHLHTRTRADSIT